MAGTMAGQQIAEFWSGISMITNLFYSPPGKGISDLASNPEETQYLVPYHALKTVFDPLVSRN